MKQTIKFFTLLLLTTTLFFSCGGDEPEEPVVYAITLSTNDFKAIEIGQSVTFHVVDNNNASRTNDVTYKANGVAFSSNTFTGTEIGSFDITATYNDIVSNIITVKVLNEAFTQKPLIEDYTGAWCGFCPRIAYSIELVEDETNNAIPVAIHNDDSMTYEFESQLRSSFGVTGLPTGKINRTIDWTYPENTNIAQITDLASDKTDIGLSISSTRSGSSLSIDVSAKFSLTHAESLNLVVYLLENGLHETQTNYTSFYGGNSSIPNMEHNHVLRKTYTALLGDAIPSADTEMNDTYTTHFDVSIPASSTGTASSNLQLVAFITDADTKTVLNAQAAMVDTTQDFD